MGLTPDDGGEKWADSWILAKSRTIKNYVATSSTYATKAIAKQAAALAAVTAAFGPNGTWVQGLRKYENNNLMGDAFTEKMNAITSLPDVDKQKVINSITKKQYFKAQLATVLGLFKAAASGAVTVPVGITDRGLNSMLMAGISSQEAVLSTGSNAAAIYAAVDTYMKDNYGWPVKP